MLDFIVSNWFWLLFLAAMLFMHLGHAGARRVRRTRP